MSRPTDSSSSSGAGAVKRLLRELDIWRKEQAEEEGIERLGPVDEQRMLDWEAVINGRGIGGGYDGSLRRSAHLPSPLPTRVPRAGLLTEL